MQAASHLHAIAVMLQTRAVLPSGTYSGLQWFGSNLTDAGKIRFS